MEEQFVVLCDCMRPSTGTGLTIPLPPELTTPAVIGLGGAGLVVDYIGNEFDWQFIPMEVRIVPRDQLNGNFVEFGFNDM